MSHPAGAFQRSEHPPYDPAQRPVACDSCGHEQPVSDGPVCNDCGHDHRAGG